MGPGDGMPPTEPKQRAEKEEGSVAGNDPPKSKVEASLFLLDPFFLPVFLFLALSLPETSLTSERWGYSATLHSVTDTFSGLWHGFSSSEGVVAVVLDRRPNQIHTHSNYESLNHAPAMPEVYQWRHNALLRWLELTCMCNTRTAMAFAADLSPVMRPVRTL